MSTFDPTSTLYGQQSKLVSTTPKSLSERRLVSPLVVYASGWLKSALPDTKPSFPSCSTSLSTILPKRTPAHVSTRTSRFSVTISSTTSLCSWSDSSSCSRLVPCPSRSPSLVLSVPLPTPPRLSSHHTLTKPSRDSYLSSPCKLKTTNRIYEVSLPILSVLSPMPSVPISSGHTSRI